MAGEYRPYKINAWNLDNRLKFCHLAKRKTISVLGAFLKYDLYFLTPVTVTYVESFT